MIETLKPTVILAMHSKTHYTKLMKGPLRAYLALKLDRSSKWQLKVNELRKI